MAPHRPKVYVSAASRGIGFAIARRFLRDGADVAISSRSGERLSQAQAELQREPGAGRLLTIVADLSRPEGQDTVFASLKANSFQPDVFVCNAGQPRESSIRSLGREQWSSDVEMILGQAVFGSQHFAPMMAEQGFGRLIFISSIQAESPSSAYITSSIPRAALLALNKVLGSEFAGRNVASFVVQLGYVDTPMLRNKAMGVDIEAPFPSSHSSGRLGPLSESYAAWAETIPARRIASADELAEVIHFLASPYTTYLTGSVLSFAGGLESL